MKDMPASRATHLEYYLQYGLNPVHYEMTDPRRHMERRASLYRILGLTPLALRGADVLEVAPGSGQNSLYLAECAPKSLTLVEPNPTALSDIRRTYEDHGSGIEPRVICSTLQEFEPREWYDVVVCENWLGSAPEERKLLRKLATFLAPAGMLVMTTVSPVGVLWNVLRKALTCRIRNPKSSFTIQSQQLTYCFGPHLRTILGMTRSVTDWVHDNVMNPAYIGVILSLPMALAELGDQLEILGTSPSFATDYRWFKELYGAQRAFNQHFLNEYASQLHNFLDYRRQLPARAPEANLAMEEAALELAAMIRSLELSGHQANGIDDDCRAVMGQVEEIRLLMADLPGEWTDALAEFNDVFGDPDCNEDRIAGMEYFGSMFGRETMYVSWEKRG
jgi:2-polyprenyl-3-methyl-5-hydroxy-6-metoxy-1,4-benzoquinol methylase